MKKIFKVLLCIVMVLSLSGCKETASMAVENYLAKYNSLHEDVLMDMDNVIAQENLGDSHKETYQSIFKKQYTDLKYEIIDEEYNGDEATVKAKVTVYDLYKAQNDASKHLASNPDEFNDENGIYDITKYITYKLDQMINATDTVDYTIDFYVVKTAKGWTVSSLSKTDLEKLHGVYNYEN